MKAATRRPLGYCAQQVDTPNTGVREQNLLSLSYGNIVRKDIAGNDGLLPESFETYNVVKRGDTVLRLTDLQNDQRSLRVGFVEERGIITSAYVTLRPNDDVDPRFFSYVLKSMDFRKDFYALGAGVRQSLKFDELKRVQVHLPGLATQRAIADYLDTESARIDALISKKQRVIELLNEGLNAFVDHEFQHLSARPTRIKYHVILNPQSVSESHDAAATINYIDIGSVGRGFLVEHPEKMTFRDAPSRARRVVRPGDVIVSTVRTYLRAVWMVTSDYADLVVSTGFAVLRPNPELLPEFFGWFCRSSTFVDDVASRSYGVSYPGISASEIVSLAMPLPTQSAQQAIATRLNEKADNYRTLAQKLERQVVLLRERRQALITAAVTGELEVPGVAA